MGLRTLDLLMSQAHCDLDTVLVWSFKVEVERVSPQLLGPFKLQLFFPPMFHHDLGWSRLKDPELAEAIRLL